MIRMKRYEVRANGEPRNPNYLGYPFAVIDTATSQIAMLANTRRRALNYAKEREKALRK